MRVRFWGTRGSVAVPGAQTVRYGGNTSCVEVRTDGGTLFILDCGTGVRELGFHLAQEHHGPIHAHILLSHTHWDHIQGFPFFMPAFSPENHFHIYSSRGSDKKLEQVLAGQMEYTYFPVALEQMGSHMTVQEIGETRLTIGDAEVSTMRLNHTAACLGYRIESRGSVVVYATDHEQFSRFVRDTSPSARPQQAAQLTDALRAQAEAQQKAFVEFVRGADLLIHDSQYTEEEYPSHMGWGHSTVEDAVRIAATGDVARLALYHHDPAHSDEAIDAMEETARGLARQICPKLEVVAAAESLTIDLPSRTATA